MKGNIYREMWTLATIFSYFILKAINSPPDKMATILADDNFKHIFLKKSCWILIKMSLKFVCKGSIDNNPVLV